MSKMSAIRPRLGQTPWCLVCNIAVVYLCYTICRVIFIIENHQLFGDLADIDYWRIFVGGLHFDTSAICYTNAIYFLLVLFPLHRKETRWMHIAEKWLFVIVNTIGCALNLADSVYFNFTQRRITCEIFREYAGNTNNTTVVGIEIMHHWYLVLVCAAICLLIAKAYVPYLPLSSGRKLRRYYITQIVWLCITAFLCVVGMRGYLPGKGTRPIAMANAHNYASTPLQAGIVVNTPFAMLRTFNQSGVVIPPYFTDEELLAFFDPVNVPDTISSDTLQPRRNVVIIMVESLSEEFMGSRNPDIAATPEKSCTPFLDSIVAAGLTWRHTFSNGSISIDGMPAVISSMPKLGTSFILSPHSLDDVSSLAKELKNWDYASAFFHGAENSSMGFKAYAMSAGFDRYYGKTEYVADPGTGGEADFDGVWAIWDEEYLQYFCRQLDSMPQPFFATVFTASSHHPFAVPERYESVFPDDGVLPIHRAVRYTDNALRLFFEKAKTQPWYENTLFVITADHAASVLVSPRYRNSYNWFRVPVIFFDPSGALPAGVRDGIAQQADIMPTVLGILGYDRPYIALGKDMMAMDPSDTFAFNWNHLPQFIAPDYFLQYDLDLNLKAVYRADDLLLRHNLIGTPEADSPRVRHLDDKARAYMQTIYIHLKTNTLRIR